MGCEAESGSIVRGHAAGWGGTRLDLVQRARQQPAFGQQGVDRRNPQGDGGPADPLEAMRAFEAANLLA